MIAPVVELLVEVQRLGIKIVAEGERLRFAPRDRMPAELIDRLRRFKTEILATLQGRSESPGANATRAERAGREHSAEGSREASNAIVEAEDFDREAMHGPTMNEGGSLIQRSPPPVETNEDAPAHAHGREAEPNPFAGWILRPDVDGRMGWEPAGLPESVRWWGRFRM